ncbi:MAG: toxin-antitoxin system HicB family antitoxin [Anaerolineales bacterium]|nr:toxin-antitoxin system HicB family antitoxin [Anaerolineales bacterium]
MGRLTLRLPDTLHQELEARAQQEGVSLNQYLVYALARHVTAKYTVVLASDEGVRQQQQRYAALLDDLGEAPDAAAAAVLAARDAEPHADADAAQLIRLLREKIAAYEVDQ